MNFRKKLGIQKINAGTSTGTKWFSSTNNTMESLSPVDGRKIAGINPSDLSNLNQTVRTAEKAFTTWRRTPAPLRGEIVRQIGLEIRTHKQDLGRLICLEMGKSIQEGYGEVQEMIDVCDFAVGQSRMLYGSTMHSERPQHRMYDHYHPLGIIGIISAFNFPVAVWAWNAMIAAVCGNVSIWKPSSQAPLTAIATQKIIGKVLKDNKLPEGIFSLLIGNGKTIGDAMLADTCIPLISFTGSVPTGRHAAEVVAGRLGKTILELGGNNAIIITPEADLGLAIPAVVFGAVGTAGQRCTTTRRLIVHSTVYKQVRKALLKAYRSLRIGTPVDSQNHVGPLVSQQAVKDFLKAIKTINNQDGKVIFGGKEITGKGYESGCYVMPTLVEASPELPIVQKETFAPILYLMQYKGNVANAIELQNNVRQGLSSAIFTNNIGESETFLAHWGSDCGIANVNIGTSGAEIGGAFGGEKETGGGRESGSDAWKAYMRRQTVTINYSSELPLAQGITFKI